MILHSLSQRIKSYQSEPLTLCDALEAKLTQVESASTQLLSAAHRLLQESSREVAKTRREQP